tara:strand:- start:1419 stop:2096 length:678 start_codon:yes stop_codon:yes gene_type:complete
MDYYDKAKSKNNESVPSIGTLTPHTTGSEENMVCLSDFYPQHINSIVKEIINAIEGAGLTRSATNLTQLSQAITANRTKIAILEDQKADGADGGTGSAGTWNTRVINTEVSDPDSIVSISSNQFTLGVGKYKITARGSVASVNGHRMRVRNITDSTTDILGQSAFESTGFNGDDANLIGYIDIADTKVFELQHWINASVGTQDFGRPTTSGDSEIYLQIVIEKIG